MSKALTVNGVCAGISPSSVSHVIAAVCVQSDVPHLNHAALSVAAGRKR